MTRVRLLAAAAVTAAAALSTVSAVAAAPAASAAAKSTSLALTVSEGESSTNVSRAATLTCNPTGGTHPYAEQVCVSLTVVDGTPRMTDADPTLMCTRIYQPVTATMVGFVDGKRVNFERTFGNACEMQSETGSLFQL